MDVAGPFNKFPQHTESFVGMLKTMAGQDLHKLAMKAYAKGDLATARSMFEECAAVQRARGASGGVAWALLGAGNVAHAQGEDETARANYAETLTLFFAEGEQEGGAFTLERLYLEYGARGRLSLKDYDALGRIKGSIEAAIERAFQCGATDVIIRPVRWSIVPHRLRNMLRAQFRVVILQLFWRSLDVGKLQHRRSSLLAGRTRFTLQLPAGFPPDQACKGVVSLRFQAGRRTVNSTQLFLGSNCRYGTRVILPRSLRGTVHVTARFLGNDLLTPQSAKTLTLRIG